MSYRTTGTYFATVRVSGQRPERKGNIDTRIYNLSRVRVVVE
ncbi:hypothetical protein [Alloscardovia criceti]|nr:hypothetical protein [Alloscardovia criceti]